jgi:hypothetical protein
MTTIRDIADFVRIINEQPEWNDTIRGILLGRELLELPQRFAEFVRVTEENNRLVAERLGQLESHVAQLQSGVTQLQTDMADMKDWRTETTQRLDRIEGRLGNLEGAEAERQVHSDIVNIASRRLGLTRARIIQSWIVARTPEFQDFINDAEDQSVITEEQGDHLEQADVILAARRRNDRQAVHAVAEVSINVADYDIMRARERAGTLSAIMGTPTLALTVGGNIEPAQQELADSLGVTTIIVPRLAI